VNGSRQLTTGEYAGEQDYNVQVGMVHDETQEYTQFQDSSKTIK